MDETRFKGRTGLRRLLNACGHTAQGLAGALRHEAAFRQEAALAAVLIPVALVSTSGAPRKQ